MFANAAPEISTGVLTKALHPTMFPWQPAGARKKIYIFQLMEKQRSIFNYSFNIRGPQEKEKIIFVL